MDPSEDRTFLRSMKRLQGGILEIGSRAGLSLWEGEVGLSLDQHSPTLDEKVTQLSEKWAQINLSLLGPDHRQCGRG